MREKIGIILEIFFPANLLASVVDIRSLRWEGFPKPLGCTGNASHTTLGCRIVGFWDRHSHCICPFRVRVARCRH